MPATRTPESERLDLVLVGSFNAAIFHPQWFLRQQLIGEYEATNAEVKVVSSQITEVEFGGVRAQVVADRLTLGTSNIAFAEKVVDLTLGVLRILPHTPIRACGINPQAHYRIETAKYWHKIGHVLAPKELIWDDLFDESGLLSLAIQAPRLGPYPGEANITVEPSDQIKPGIAVRVNTHYGVPEEGQQTGASAVQQFITNECEKALGEARRVADKILQKIRPND